jgi:hypothetical protein
MTVPSGLLDAVKTWIKKAEEGLYSTELCSLRGRVLHFRMFVFMHSNALKSTLRQGA